MRIALIAQHFAEYAYGLALALQEEHEVLLILEVDNAEGEIGHIPSCRGNLSTQALRHVGHPTTAFANASRIASIIRQFNPDVIHVQEVMRDAVAAVLPLLRLYPLVVTVHDTLPHSGERLSLWQKRYRLYQTLQRESADILITHGEELAQVLRTITKRSSRTVLSIPHGVLGRLPGDRTPAQYRMSGSICFIGRMQAYKGLDVFLDAVDLLSARSAPFHAVIAGRGPSLDDLRPDFEQRQEVTLVDRYLTRHELLQTVDDSAAVALPYRDGTQTGIGLLAVGRGRPIVASQVGSIPEVCREGVNGCLVPPGDPQALADALERILTDRSLAHSLARGAEALAESDFSWRAVAHLTTQAYVSAAESHKSTKLGSRLR